MITKNNFLPLEALKIEFSYTVPLWKLNYTKVTHYH